MNDLIPTRIKAKIRKGGQAGARASDTVNRLVTAEETAALDGPTDWRPACGVDDRALAQPVMAALRRSFSR